ncbi:MAG: YitT family protein [Bdellovibrionota bacterium]
MLGFILQSLSLICGMLLAAFGVEGFLQPGGFIDGGITGVSMLLSELFHIPLAVLIFVINLPFLLLGYLQIGRAFFLRSFLAIASLSLCLTYFSFPQVTNDKLLTAVFGGMFVGSGIGLAIRGGGVVDGTDILAVVLSKGAGMSVGQVVLYLNILIFVTAAVFLGIEPAMYSILTYFSASRMMDFLIYGIEEYCALHIMSSKTEEICAALLDGLGRGVTRLSGRGGKTDEAREILYCVATRLEIHGIEAIVRQVDESAFIVVSPVRDVHGGVVKRHAVDRLHQ